MKATISLNGYGKDFSDKDLENKGAEVEHNREDINRRDNRTRYATVYVSSEKGSFLSGEFDIEGEFDPKKLTVSCTQVYLDYYKGADEYYLKDDLVTGFKYNGNEI